MILLFGKYKDCDTSDCNVPTSYLQWLEEQRWIGLSLQRELNQEIERRTGNRPGRGKVTIKDKFFSTD